MSVERKLDFSASENKSFEEAFRKFSKEDYQSNSFISDREILLENPNVFNPSSDENTLTREIGQISHGNVRTGSIKPPSRKMTCDNDIPEIPENIGIYENNPDFRKSNEASKQNSRRHNAKSSSLDFNPEDTVRLDARKHPQNSMSILERTKHPESDPFFNQFTLYENGRPFNCSNKKLHSHSVANDSAILLQENFALKQILREKEGEIGNLKSKLKSYESHYLRKRAEVKEMKEKLVKIKGKKDEYKGRLHTYLDVAETPKALSSLLSKKCETDSQMKIQTQQIKVLGEKMNILFRMICPNENSSVNIVPTVSDASSPGANNQRRPSFVNLKKKDGSSPELLYEVSRARGNTKDKEKIFQKYPEKTSNKSVIIDFENVILLLYLRKKTKTRIPF